MIKPQPLRILLIAALWLFPPMIARADPLDGTYMVMLDGPDSIWGLEAVNECETLIEPGVNAEICTDMDFQRDSKGGLFGTGSLSFDATVDGIDVDGILTGGIKGQSKGSDRKGTRIKLSFKFEGPINATGLGMTFDAKTTGKFKGEIDLAGNLVGGLRQKVCLKGVGCERIEASVVEGATGGAWTLQLVINHLDGTLSGTGSALLPGGVVRNMFAKGKYTEGKGSRLSLQGGGVDKGAKMKLKNVQSSGPGLIDSGSLKFKVDGFRGSPEL